MIKSNLLLLAGSVFAFASADAALVHHYDFNTANVANDTVGTANGTLVNGATVTGGSLNTPGGGSGQGGTAPAANLPAASTAGISTDFSIQTFFTVTNIVNYATLFSFATDQTNFLIAVPNRADTGMLGVAGRYNNGNQLILSGPTVVTGTQYDMTTTYIASTGLLSLYINGVFQQSGTITGLNLSSYTAFDGINGNAPYGDNAMTGSNNDFRIYNNALTQAQVTQLDTLGANATNAQINAALVPEPSTWMAMFAGIGALLGLQRFRRSVA